MYGSKDSKSQRKSKLHDQFKSYNNFNNFNAPKVTIFTKALLPLKFLPKHFSLFPVFKCCKKKMGKGVELVGGGSVINGVVLKQVEYEPGVN